MFLISCTASIIRSYVAASRRELVRQSILIEPGNLPLSRTVT